MRKTLGILAAGLLSAAATAPISPPPPRQGANAVEQVVIRTIARVAELEPVLTRSAQNVVDIVFNPPNVPVGPGQPAAMTINVESFDTEAAAVAGQTRGSFLTPQMATRRDTLNGAIRHWWGAAPGFSRVNARVGRHVVNVNAMRPTTLALVPRVLEALIPELERIVPTRPARPWALESSEVIVLALPADIRDALEPGMVSVGGIKGAAYDLNADGVDDYLLRATPSRCGPPTPPATSLGSTGDCPFTIIDGASRRNLGTVTGNPIFVRAETSGGFPRIETLARRGSIDGTVTSYVFDGNQYVVSNTTSLDNAAGREFLAAFDRVARWLPGR